MNSRETMKINNDGILEIGGVKATELVEKYGSPIYVYDVAHIRNILKAFVRTINEEYGDGRVAYAGKALSITAMYKIIEAENAYIDVVSMGEMHTAINSGYGIGKAYFHGNNKLVKELEYAIDNGIGTIVIDNSEEISIIDRLAAERGIKVNVSIRLNPGVEAHTHAYIQTAKADSKFGFSIANGDATTAIKNITEKNNLIFQGIHYHIGSQIFDTDAFRLAVNVGTDYIAALKNEYGIEIEELNIGGGFGVYYVDGDPKYDVEEYCNYLRIIIGVLKSDIVTKNIKKPRLVIEPGRSIVAEAGVTLYRVGVVRQCGNIKYVCIDGGMGDNIRPALYQAEYEAMMANRACDKPVEQVHIAGKFCESSDIIIKNAMLPAARRGDILAVFTTGAYGYSMASNYNRNPIPAIVMTENGKSDYAVKPQTLEDITRNDVIPEFLK